MPSGTGKTGPSRSDLHSQGEVEEAHKVDHSGHITDEPVKKMPLEVHEVRDDIVRVSGGGGEEQYCNQVLFKVIWYRKAAKGQLRAPREYLRLLLYPVRFISRKNYVASAQNQQRITCRLRIP